MVKICEIDSCNYPVFSKKQCLSHWRVNYGKPIKKRSEKGEIKAKEKKEILKLDEAFYLEIWAERKEHNCEVCREWLGYHPYNWMFDHIKPKSRFPELRHEKSNISLLCLQCHSQKHN